MASEPERPIENLLRAAAKQRRDEAGPPFELHPATRRLLQGEAARKFPPAQSGSPSLFATLGRLWPRFAWALAILAVLGVAVWLLVPLPAKNNQAALLASNDPIKQAPRVGKPVRPAPAALTAPPIQPEAAAEAKLQAVADSDKDKFATASIPAAGVPVMPAPSPPAAEARMAYDGALADAPVSLAREESVASSAARKSRVEEDSSASRQVAALAAADDLLAPSPPAAVGKAAGASLIQRFVQVAPGSAATAPPADEAKSAQAVLASFLVEQTDRKLRITDADGSVYEGYVRAAATARPAREIKVEAPAAARASKATGGTLRGEATAVGLSGAQPVLQNYTFRVAGTNRTLRKKVVFSGNLVAASSPVGPQPTGAPAVLGTLLEESRAGSVQQNALRVLNSRITGKAVIGSGKAIEINALPTGL